MSETIDRVLEYLGEKKPPVEKPVAAAPRRADVVVRAVRTAKKPKKGYAEGRERVVRVHAYRAPRVSSGAVVRLANKLTVSTKDLLNVSDIPLRSYQRRVQTNAALTASESDRVLRIARVAKRAESVFEDADKASRWMATPSRILGARPLELLGSDAGAADVENELIRIEHGDFA